MQAGCLPGALLAASAFRPGLARRSTFTFYFAAGGLVHRERVTRDRRGGGDFVASAAFDFFRARQVGVVATCRGLDRGLVFLQDLLREIGVASTVVCRVGLRRCLGRTCELL